MGSWGEDWASCAVAPVAGADFVWHVDLRQPPEWVAEGASLLSVDELDRGRGSRPEVQSRQLVARIALRLVLARCVQRPPGELRFVVGPWGKPRLADEDGGGTWHFSLAHTGDCCVIAVTRAGRVGVDVERVAPVEHLDEIVGRYFSPDEAAEIAPLAGRPKLEAFYRCWTQKEAYLKATGSGLMVALNSFSVAVDGPPAVRRTDGDDPNEWTMATLHPDADVIGAVAVRRESAVRTSVRVAQPMRS